MVQIFLDMSKKVGIFMIISQTLLHIGIAKKYEKYIRLIISFMVVTQIVFSFAALGKTEAGNFFSFLEEDFQIRWQRNVSEFEEELEEIRKKTEEKIINQNQNFYDISEKETEQKKIHIERIKIE